MATLPQSTSHVNNLRKSICGGRPAPGKGDTGERICSSLGCSRETSTEAELPFVSSVANVNNLRKSICAHLCLPCLALVSPHLSPKSRIALRCQLCSNRRKRLVGECRVVLRPGGALCALTIIPNTTTLHSPTSLFLLLLQS
jgi:hypothetical protein